MGFVSGSKSIPKYVSRLVGTPSKSSGKNVTP